MPFAVTPPSILVSILPMLEAVNDGIQIFDLEGKLIYVNEAGADMFGYGTPEAYLKEHRQSGYGLTMMAFHDAANQPMPLAQYPCTQAIKGIAFQAKTLTYLDRQQRDRCAVIRSFPLRDAAGAVLFGAVVSHDQTQSYLADQAIQQRTQQLYQVTEAVPSLIACLDAQERHSYANRAYLNAFGKTADDIAGASLWEVVGPVIYHQLEDVLRQALQGDRVDVCIPLMGPQQKVEFKHINAIPQYEGRQVVGVYLALNDITAHKHIADLLQHEAHFFRDALEVAQVGIWEWDLVKQKIVWSPPQEKLFGMTPGKFDGEPETFLALVDDRDREGLRAAIDLALQPGRNFAAEFRIRLSDDTVRWLSHRGQVLRDETGQALRMVGVTFDVTNQKQAEEKLLQQVRRDHLIAKISQHISRSENLNEVLPQVVGDVRRYLNADRIAIIDLQEKMAGKVAFEDHDPRVESMLTWEMRHPWAIKEAFLKKYRQGYPIAVSNVHDQALGPAELAFLEFFQIEADLTVPLLEDKELWGLLSVHSSRPREWQSEDRRLLETLGTQISTAIQRDRLHRNLTRANQKLKRFAYLDGLTQVANRRRFEQFINHEWRRLMREQSPLALIMVDIDHFKAYNDIYGHQAGDECLRRIAGTLRSAVQRPADMVARYGGEEFAVVLPNTNLEGAETVAQKIRLMIRSQKIPHQGSTSDKIVTMSMGIAVMFPHPLKAPDNLIEAADMALYDAKANGRDRIVCHNPFAQN